MPEEICKTLSTKQANKSTGNQQRTRHRLWHAVAKYFIDQFHGKIIVESHEAKDNQINMERESSFNFKVIYSLSSSL